MIDEKQYKGYKTQRILNYILNKNSENRNVFFRKYSKLTHHLYRVQDKYVSNQPGTFF